MSRIQSGSELAKATADSLNCFSGIGIPEFVEEMSRQHRTLQQSFTRLVVAWLEHLGKLPEGRFDLRNQASVELGREFLNNISYRNRVIPYI